MTSSELQTLGSKLLSLALFRGIQDTDTVQNLFSVLTDVFISENTPAAYAANVAYHEIDAYGALCRSIYEHGGDISLFVKDYVLNVDDFFVSMFATDQVKSASASIADCLESELDTLQQLADLKSEDIIDLLECDINLPSWNNSQVDIKGEYLDLLTNLRTRGFGHFRNTMMFKVRCGELIPVKKAEYQTLSQLYGYERERGMVLQNTRALAEGMTASNVLLYGDAGTGKSSTVKACAAAFFDQGVRLVEFSKNQVGEIPDMAEKLSSNPLRFIFFIDDLTFEENDADFYALKGILEGNISGTGSNILIYATSNRRHLIKESSAQRQGDDLHLNDTLQETMSLSSRFGLTVTFMKPEKDLYLEIMEKLALEQGLITEDADPETIDGLRRRAEAFAIRANGRSPRTAKQFVTLAKTGLR